MNTLIAGAALLGALALPAFAGDGRAAPTATSTCVPYDRAVALIEDDGGQILGRAPVPFTRNGTALYFTARHIVMAAGISGADSCVFLPAATLGHLGFNPGIL